MKKEIILKLKQILTLILSVLLFLLLIKLLGGILLPFLLAMILAYLLNPIVEYWETKGFSRSGGIFLTYFFLVAGILFIAVFIFPVFWRQLEVLALSIPHYTHQIQGFFQDSYDNYKRIAIPNAIRNEIDLALIQLELILTQTIGQVINGILSVFTHAFSIFISPVLAYYILSDQKRITEVLLKSFPPSRVKRFQNLWQEIDSQLNSFIKGHLLVATLVGVVTSIGFMIIKVDFPFLLGLIVGIAEIIPYFGPVIGAIPALGIALLDSKRKALYALVLMIIIQQLESNILSPKIIGSSVGLHPLLVISVLLLGGKIYGVLGMFFAIPVTLILRVLWFHLVTPLLVKANLEPEASKE